MKFFSPTSINRALLGTILLVINCQTYSTLSITTGTDYVTNFRATKLHCNSEILAQCQSTLGSNEHSNGTISCFLHTLESDKIPKICATRLKSDVTNVLGVCQSLNCTGVPSKTEPLQSLVCLTDTYFSLHEGDCKSQLKDLFGNLIPCFAESNKYCVNTNAIMACLNDTLVRGSDISMECKKRVVLWSADYDGADIEDGTLNNIFKSDDGSKSDTCDISTME
jgi:hypothetical protein